MQPAPSWHRPQPGRARVRTTLAALLLGASMVAASCSSAAPEPAGSGATSGSADLGATREPAAPTTTSRSAASTTISGPAASFDFTLLSTERYLTIAGLDMPIDAYVPVGDGPWPIVVVFHGNSAAAKDTESSTIIAEAAAAQGLLAFAPTWIAGDPFPLDVADIVDLRYAASCAVAFAQDWATELNGDPSDTVTYGFSAGAGPALSALVAPTAAVPQCAVDAAPLPVAGAVLGDGEYFFQSRPFDTAFDDDVRAMQSEVASLNDRTRWPADLDARVFVWAAAEGTAPRALEEPGAPNWIDDRDPDGAIRGDLVDLGRLDDGVIDYIDGAHLLELRLQAAGMETDLEIFPGGHSVVDKVDPLVAALRSVSTSG